MMKLRYLLGSLALGSMVLLTAGSARADILEGLNAYYPLDANADDIAGTLEGTASAVADNGTIVPPTSTRGTPVSFDREALPEFGTAANFSGAGFDSHISIADSVDINKEGQDLSISAWFQIDAFDTGWQALMAKGEGSNYRIARQGDTNFMAYAGGSRDIRYDPAPDPSPTAPSDTLWHHVAATTKNGGLTTLWIDGVRVQDAGQDPAVESAIVNENSTDPPTLLIGANPGSGTLRTWKGGIDDVGIWNRVLDDNEILGIWNDGMGATIPEAVAVPEPATGLLMVMGVLGLLAAGRNRVRRSRLS